MFVIFIDLSKQQEFFDGELFWNHGMHTLKASTQHVLPMCNLACNQHVTNMHALGIHVFQAIYCYVYS